MQSIGKTGTAPRIWLVPVFGAVLAFLSSCSTTRILAEGESRLEKNIVKIEDSRTYPASDITPYIKQQPNTNFIFGWNPGLSIYNWAKKDSDSFFAKLWRKLGVPPVVYDRSLVDASIENITKHLQWRGYYRGAVSASEKFTGKKVKVTYNVKLGERIPIDSIEYRIPSDTGFRKEFYLDTCASLVHNGTFLSEEVLNQESERGATVFRNQGYYEFLPANYSFHADTLKRPGFASLEYTVNDYARNDADKTPINFTKYRFGNFTVKKPADFKFRDKLVGRLCAPQPGEMFSDKAIKLSYDRLSSISAIGSVNMELNPHDSVIDCAITLSPAKQQSFKVKLEGSATSTGMFGVSPSLTYNHKNIFGGGEQLTLNFTGDFQFKPKDNTNANEFGVSATLAFPNTWLFYNRKTTKNLTKSEVTAAFTYQDRPEFNRQTISTAYGVTGSISKRFFYHVYPIKIGYVRLVDISDSFQRTIDENPFLKYSYTSHIDAGLSMLLYYTTDASVVPQGAYQYARLNVETSGNLIGLFRSAMPTDSQGQHMLLGVPYSQFVKSELNLGHTFRWGRKSGQALALHFVTGSGFAYGNSTVIPFDRQFYVGGANGMRAWQARSLGPGFAKMQEAFSIPSQTGDVKLEFDLEYRMKLFWKLEGAVFAETGNVWTMPKIFKDAGVINDVSEFSFKTFYKSLAADWGFGLRLNFNFILIRFDLGLKVRDPSRDEPDRWVRPNQWFTSDGNTFNFAIGYPF